MCCFLLWGHIVQATLRYDVLYCVLKVTFITCCHFERVHATLLVHVILGHIAMHHII